MGNIGRWLKAWVAALNDRRESARLPLPLPLVAYYWNGASPQAYQVKAVSQDGAYIVTPDRWYIGTVLRLTFQYGSSRDGNGTMPALPLVVDHRELTHVVRAKLVRMGPDGMGVRLIYLNRRERRNFKKFLATALARRNS